MLFHVPALRAVLEYPGVRTDGTPMLRGSGAFNRWSFWTFIVFVEMRHGILTLSPSVMGHRPTPLSFPLQMSGSALSLWADVAKQGSCCKSTPWQRCHTCAYERAHYYKIL